MLTLDSVPIPVSAVHHLWDKVEPFIAASCSHSGGDLPLEEVKLKVLSGEYILIGVFEPESKDLIGAITARVYNRFNDRVFFITAIGGRAIINQPSFEKLCDVIKTFGATCIEADARESAFRLYRKVGFRQKAIRTNFNLR